MTAACLASLGHRVFGVDRDQHKINKIRDRRAPFYEPGLAELVRENTASALATLIAAPVMLCVALLVKLTSPGPALLRQQRVGKNDRLFTLYKFHSMVTDAEAHSGAVWA